MRILMVDMGSYTFRDLKEAILEENHEVDELYYFFKDRFKDEFFSERIALTLKRKAYDCIVSINFLPLIAVAAHEFGIPYISWSYDSPLAEQLTEYFHFDTNHIYLFDRVEVEKFNASGFNNVYHLPLAVNTKRISKLSFSKETNQKYKADISFVGMIYDSSLDTLLYCADDYTKGFVEALFQAQFKIYGCNFIEKAIPDSLIESLNGSYLKLGTTKFKLNKRGLAYAINTQITHVERTILLESLSENHTVNLYSTQQYDLPPAVNQSGPVKYYTDMYAVFKNSKLNLCPTLKSIESGIPLRALDILGSASVLFSNYQPELAEYFVDGEDVIMYESLEDAVDKANYYIENPKTLDSIAISGFNIVQKFFSYSDRINTLLVY
ncbi:MAG: DUF3880 domain-containing protein [Lachnospiraceae bacterium]|nr:DUF3880 domain-containing protein [Lachnospiraceae bacterium]